MDLLVAGTMLLCLGPLLLTVYLIIKITDPGPAFFVQQRMGRGGIPFGMYKFRSMVMNADALKTELLSQNERVGPAFKMTNDPRITPIGRFIRKWSIDELPQLFNVLRGEMSLVGPRPLPLEEDQQMAQWHNMRRQANPGLTCYWQISDRDSLSFDEWVRLDIKYLRERSLLTDLKILLMTVPAVLSQRGAK
ncbi:sugar transferase [Marinobacterium jannaschii]|uniref:sugar transferase n=1 Tax=Marinobacterium jannaschii TaxID=64970 RepID=UPI000683E12E|nr:sugar transferase [Marinobacterium jannaschii]